MFTCNASTNKCNTCQSLDDVYGYVPTPFSESNIHGFGGGTAWLTTQAPVTPGQVFNLDFYIWDTGDSYLDSTVILDNFQWRCEETSVGTFASGAAN